MKLTAGNVRTLPIPTDRTEKVYFDSDVKGFGLRIKASGARSYIMAWKISGQHRRVTIGSVTDTDFGTAKNRAKDIKADIRRGADPVADIKTAKADAAQTFEVLCGQYLASLRPHRRARSMRQTERLMTVYTRDLDKRPARAIRRADIAAVLTTVTEKNGPVVANRLRSGLSAFYGWLIQRGLADANPVIDSPQNVERSRERVLTPAELRLVWHAAGDDSYGTIIKLLALTGARANEIALLRPSEIGDGMLILPAERCKNNKPHLVPLAPVAAELLARQLRQRVGRPFLFGRNEASAFGGWSFCKRNLDARIAAANGGKSIAPWRVHDLRRCFASYAGGGLPAHMLERLPTAADKELAAGLGMSVTVIEACLGHIGGTRGGIVGVYQVGTHESAKRQALEAWADHLLRIVEGRAPATNVATLRRA